MLVVLVGDPHGEVPDVEDSTASPADVPDYPQNVALLGLGHHGMAGQLDNLVKEPAAACIEYLIRSYWRAVRVRAVV